MKEKIQKLFIHKDISIKEAMKKMSEGAERILFVVGDNLELIGSLTDGDIRKWILADKSLREKVAKVYNKKPAFVDKAYSLAKVKKLMLEKKLEWIPVVDNAKRIVDVYLWDDVFDDSQPKQKPKIDVPVVIMAGGKGTRLDPFTRILPKSLVPIGEKPVVEVIMDNFYKSGCKDFYLILGYKSGMIKSYFDNTKLPYHINYVLEQEELGTAGGLKLIYKDMPKTFFVSNCDIIIKADYRDIYDFHIRNKCQVTLVSSMNHFKIPYGVVKLSASGDLDDIVEKPEYDLLVNTGMYVIEKTALKLIARNRPMHFTDLMMLIKKKGKGKVGVYPVSEKAWLDTGQWEQYRETIKNL